MKASITGTDSLVVFRNSQGLEARGTLLHLNRNQVVFEVYNPYSIVQLSEVLRDLRVLRGERAIYTGRAVVSNLVATGLMVIVSATLVDAWSDLTGLPPGGAIREEVRTFVSDWEVTYNLTPPYQLAVSNLRAFLGELSRWLDQVEVAVEPTGSPSAPEIRRELVEELAEPLEPKLAELYRAFEKQAAQVPEDQVVAHKAFARREIHPLTLCSPFVHRTFTKPLGYAGDYEMVNMILGDPVEGGNTYARVINTLNLRTAPTAAHRNRIGMLLDRIKGEVGRAAAAGRPFRALNVGCGPAAELQSFFLSGEAVLDRCRFDLLDFNQETLDHAKEKLAAARSAGGREPECRYVHKSIHDLLKEARSERDPGEPSYDMVYCAGLFDYLSDRICRRLMRLFADWTEPGGMVVATNVHRRNPGRYFMEHVLEWYLTYRDEGDMLALAPDPQRASLEADPTGVNVFLDFRKGS